MRAGESRLYFLNLTPLNYKIILSGRTPTLLRTSEMCLNRLTLRAACREFAAVASSTTTTLSGPCSLLNTSVIARCICKDKQANQSKLTCPRHTHIPAATPPPHITRLPFSPALCHQFHTSRRRGRLSGPPLSMSQPPPSPDAFAPYEHTPDNMSSMSSC